MYLNLWRYKAVRHRNSNLMIQPEPEGSTQGYLLVNVEVLSDEVLKLKNFKKDASKGFQVIKSRKAVKVGDDVATKEAVKVGDDVATKEAIKVGDDVATKEAVSSDKKQKKQGGGSKLKKKVIHKTLKSVKKTLKKGCKKKNFTSDNDVLIKKVKKY
uniref:Uncharacterized protein n=1 Tax=Tanacetum cinerariifolium TaxID=118510 RepID=A0A6L2M2A9_TANCI|nr:hypothetical protein [Tanacetum cinerariifolium]